MRSGTPVFLYSNAQLPTSLRIKGWGSTWWAAKGGLSEFERLRSGSYQNVMKNANAASMLWATQNTRKPIQGRPIRAAGKRGSLNAGGRR